MILQLEDRWGTLAILEYEHGAREALLTRWRAGELTFEEIAQPDQEAFIKETAAPYATQSFRQAKEFFRHAETSSWLVKPLLLYYGMLTAVKAALVFDTADFFLTNNSRTHGLSRVKAAAPSLASDQMTVQTSGVFQFARRALRGQHIPESSKIPVGEILRRLPEVFVSYSMVVAGSTPKFCPTDLPRTASAGPSQPHKIVFDLPEQYVDVNQAELPDALSGDFDLLHSQNGTKRYVSKTGWMLESDSRVALEYGEPLFLTPLLDGNAALILPIVVNGSKYQFTEIELIYLITFYFSEIARYLPHFWLNLHSGSADFSVLLCQDVLRSCENKFLRLLQRTLAHTLVGTLKTAATARPNP